MAFFRSAYPIAYEPIPVAARVGKSHIKPLRDGVRFLLIIFKIATLYSPLKLFAPTAVAFGTLGLGYYAYTFITQGRFTNMAWPAAPTSWCSAWTAWRSWRLSSQSMAGRWNCPRNWPATTPTW